MKWLTGDTAGAVIFRVAVFAGMVFAGVVTTLGVTGCVVVIGEQLDVTTSADVSTNTGTDAIEKLKE